MAFAKSPIFFIFFMAVSLSSQELKVRAVHQINADITTSGFLSDSVCDNMADTSHLLRKASKSRKLLLEGDDEILEPDYELAGPNPRHDPKKGKGRGRGLSRILP